MTDLRSIVPTLLEEPSKDRFVAKESCGFFPMIFAFHGEDIELDDEKPMWGNRRLNIIIMNFATIDVLGDNISFDGVYGVWSLEYRVQGYKERGYRVQGYRATGLSWQPGMQ